jgi:hypothetical protein
LITFAPVALKSPFYRFGLSLASSLGGLLSFAKQHKQHARLVRFGRWRFPCFIDEDCIERAALSAFPTADAFFFVDVYDAILLD